MTPVSAGFEAVQRYYPRSFLRLLLLSFAAVALPFAIAFFAAALHVEELADRSEIAMSEAVRAAHASRTLVEEIPGLERVARQYLVLGDKALLRDYARLRAGFREIAGELARLPLDEAQVRELDLAIAQERDLNELLSRTPRSVADRRALTEGFVLLAERARGILDASNSMVARAVEEVRASAKRAQDLLWWRLAAVTIVGILVCLGVTVLVARPIRQLDQAIRRLGGGQFAEAIQVDGPSDLIHLGARLEWLRRRLADLEQQRQLFLRHVSHELKSPLTALREGTDLLARGTAGSLGTVQADIVGILKQKCAQLQERIEALVDYQRVQENAMRLDPKPLRLDELARRVLEDHRLATLGRGIRAETRLAPASVEGDEEALRAVIDNLVSNAIKYSPEGGTVSLSLYPGPDSVQLIVGDSGPGVAREDQQRIFDWFYRAEPGKHGRVGGSGLGLAIAKEFVAAHGGTIQVVNDHLPGARFRVALPVKAAERSA